MSSEENYIKLDDIPQEVWICVAVLVVVLLSYCLCMRQGYQDNWIGAVPPGPVHLPFIGCLLHLLPGCRLSSLTCRMFLQHGSHVKFCVCKTQAVLTCGRECEDQPDLVSVTGDVLVFILRALGLSLPTDPAFREECSRLMRVMYNYQLPLEAVREMMQDLDNSGLTKKKKKLEYLVFQLTREKVTLDKEEVESLEECSRKIEIFSSYLEENPTMFLPVFHYFPWYILQRKRIYKNVSKVQQKLCEILNGKVKNDTADADENVHKLFFIIFVFINISKTVFKKQKAKAVQKKCVCPEQQVRSSDDVVTPLTKGLSNQMREFTHLSSPSERAVFIQRKKVTQDTPDPDEITVVSVARNCPSYDICGLRFYIATRSTKLGGFNLPQGCLVIYYSTE